MPPPRSGRIAKRFLQEVGCAIKATKVGEETPHLIMGEFSSPTRTELYDEWRRENEWWQLNDPNSTTRNVGGIPDKVLMHPGMLTPAELFPALGGL